MKNFSSSKFKGEKQEKEKEKKMQRIINNPNNVVDDMIQGFIKAHPDIIEKRRMAES